MSSALLHLVNLPEQVSRTPELMERQGKPAVRQSGASKLDSRQVDSTDPGHNSRTFVAPGGLAGFTFNIASRIALCEPA